MTAPRRPARRGQAHTLEGVAAALLVVVGVLMALQVTVVTPLTSGTANQHVENQLGGTAEGLLTSADERGQLRPTLLYWNDTAGGFHGAGESGAYVTAGPSTRFGERLDATFDNGTAVNVDVRFLTADDGRETRSLARSGTPADNAVTVDRTVTLYDGDELLAANGSRSGTTLGAADRYFAPDAAPGDPTYNVVEVEVVVWRA